MSNCQIETSTKMTYRYLKLNPWRASSIPLLPARVCHSQLPPCSSPAFRIEPMMSSPITDYTVLLDTSTNLVYSVPKYFSHLPAFHHLSFHHLSGEPLGCPLAILLWLVLPLSTPFFSTAARVIF